MTSEERAFLQRRRVFVKHWKIAAILSVFILFAMAVNLFLNTRHMIDPLHVTQLIEARELASGTIIMMAAMLPYVILFLFFVMLVLIVYATVVIRNEKRYLQIIDNLQDDT